MGPRCSSVETQVCHRSYIIAASMCAAEFLCALDVFARHTSSRITFLTLTIVGRSRGDVSFHQDVFQTFGFPEGQDGWFFEDFTQFWVFLYGCPVLTNDAG